MFLPELIDFLFEGIEFADFAVNFHIKHLSFGDFLEDLFELAFEHINILKPYVFIGGFSIEKVIFSDLTGFIWAGKVSECASRVIVEIDRIFGVFFGLEVIFIILLWIEEPESIELWRMDLFEAVVGVFDLLQDALELWDA